MMLRYIEGIVDAARSAPSHGNLQPWRVRVDGEAISFYEDPDRDRSAMNAGGRMARIAVGGAVELAVVRARRIGATVRFATPPGGALVTLVVSAPKRDAAPDKARLRRATNRRLYDARPIDDEILVALREATPAIDSVGTHWFGRERVRVVAPVVETAESLVYEIPQLRDAILGTLRMDGRDRDEVTHGVSVAALELSASERVTLDTLRRTPQEVLARTGAFRKMGARARRLMESASGVCVIETRGWDAVTDVSVGRSMQRAWLALTRLGMVAHPMVAVPVLESMTLFDDPSSLDETARTAVGNALSAFRLAFPNIERASRVAFLMRVGWAPEPTVRVGRRPLVDFTGEG